MRHSSRLVFEERPAVRSEYRYVSLGGSGNMRADFLNERPIQFVTVDGDQVDHPARSFRRTAISPRPSAALACARTGRLLVRPRSGQLYSTDSPARRDALDRLVGR